MRLRNMLIICLVFRKSKPRYAYNHYAYKKTCTTYPKCLKVIKISLIMFELDFYRCDRQNYRLTVIKEQSYKELSYLNWNE